jgi:ketopantoate reductase
MRFLVAGAGAIGAYIGARMAQAGFDVTLFARGPHLRAMQERGVQVKSAAGDFVARPKIAGSLEELGPVDVVFLGVKAHGVCALAPQLKPVLGPDTTVVSTQNGIPWWYFQGFGGEWDGLRLESVDPKGVISANIPARQVQMVRDPGVCSVIRNIMEEVEAVSKKLGMELPVSIDQRIAGAEKVGEHKTSMLQDLEAGRPLELEALVGAVVELGNRVGLPMTCTRTVYNCTKLLSASVMQQPQI